METKAVNTILGSGQPGNTNGKSPFTSTLSEPEGIAVVNGVVYIADTGNNVWKKFESGRVTMLAGSSKGVYKDGQALKSWIKILHTFIMLIVVLVL